MSHRNIQFFGVVGGIIVDVFYVASILNLLRLIYMCAYTEPGVIPAIPSKRSDSLKRLSDNNNGIFVNYKSHAERAYDGRNLEYFFDEDRFQYARIVDANSDAYELKDCKTCGIIRPPRAFHCGTCGVCVEAQDHHCPWMGTCIGKRNLKYFMAFLLMTALHAFATAGICTAYFTKVTIEISEFDFYRSNERMLGLLSIGVGLYAGVIGLTLFCFAIYSLCLVCENVTSNENLRTRWHAKYIKAQQRKRDRLNRMSNESMSPEQLEELGKLRDDDALEQNRRVSCCSKLRYFFCAQSQPSHLETYLQLKQTSGIDGDYSVIGNESILKKYGIEIPDVSETMLNNVH